MSFAIPSNSNNFKTLSIRSTRSTNENVSKWEIFPNRNVLFVRNVCGKRRRYEVAAKIAELIGALGNLDTCSIMFGFSDPHCFKIIAEALGTSPKLKRIPAFYIPETKGSGSSLKYLLANTQSLENFNLSYSPSLDTEMKRMSEGLEINTTLTRLTLDGRQKKGMFTHVLNALTRNTTLQTLIAENNSIEFRSTSHFKGLSVNRTLKDLDLEDNNIQGKSAGRFFEALSLNSGIQELNLGKNPIATSDPTINEYVFKSLGLFLKNNETMTSLDLTGCTIGSQIHTFADNLRDNTTLKRLYLSNTGLKTTEMTSSVFTAMGLQQGIEVLDLCVSNLVGAASVALGNALRNNNSLTTLNLSLCQISTNDWEPIAMGLKSNTCLRKLVLDKIQVPQAAVSLAPVARKLFEPRALCEALHNNTTLTSLSLGNNRLGDSQMVHVVGLVGRNNAIRVLNLDNNPYSDDTRDKMAVAMAGNYGIERLIEDFVDYSSTYPALEKICNRNQKTSIRYAILSELLLNYILDWERKERPEAKRGVSNISDSQPSTSSDVAPQKLSRNE
jgi:Ran GTPase-activating protein (RanGAP) involved in mRNA processing and transport